MSEFARIGVDTSEAVFTLHGIDAAGRPVLRTNLRRAQMIPFFRKIPPTIVAMEACGSSHYWARQQVRLEDPALIPPFADLDGDAEMPVPMPREEPIEATWNTPETLRVAKRITNRQFANQIRKAAARTLRHSTVTRVAAYLIAGTVTSRQLTNRRSIRRSPLCSYPLP